MEYCRDRFLLADPIAEKLYRDCAADLPIIDYHNHLPVRDLISDRKYTDMCALWIDPDPYKHRAMRICGVPEKYITGDAEPFEKFEKWCEIFPALVGNPLFDWSLAELNRVFGIRQIPSAANCREIWDKANALLQEDGKNGERFRAVLQGRTLSEGDKTALVCHLLRMLGGLYAGHGTVMQLHMGARRSTSDRLKNAAGPAGGYAAIGKSVDVQSVTAFLNDLEAAGGLPKTLLFSLNPADHAVLSALSGSFSRDGTAALVSEGPAWWWCDHIGGITAMLDACAGFSVLSTFIGMTTDSRSVLSFSRHDYFRRVLCMWIGEKVRRGILPEDCTLLRGTVEKICYTNAKRTVEG